MLSGEQGPVRQWAIRHQIAVGDFFDAADFVTVGQAHVMADTESLGEAGVVWLEGLAGAQPRCRVRIPTITDPRGLDLASYKRLRQTDAMAAIESRAIAAFEALGVLMTNTCINYQTILPPVRGEHLALGDTGVVIYSNSVMGARSNFEGGPSALAAGLTGVTPSYGYHLDQHRAGTLHFAVQHQPVDFADWGALGGIVGRAANSYWQVPVVTGLREVPNSDQLKHFGAALASFGSVAMFHMPGVTPEAPTLADAFHGRTAPPATLIGKDEFTAFYAGYAATGDKVDVVVFAAPQLSLIEMPGACRLAPWPPRKWRDLAHRHHLARDQVRRRSHGAHPPHRGCRRHRCRGGMLLSDVRAGDGGSQWLAAPPDQFGQAGEYNRWLRLQTNPRQHGALRR
jgi:predicted aconitase